MNRILLSLLTIGFAATLAGAATYAYFSSQQQITGNVISTGTLNFEGKLTDTSGTAVSNISAAGLAPGDTVTRCLWIKNTGSVAGRYKVYAASESGNFNLGNQLTITATLNPTSGACSGIDNPFGGGTLYGPDNLLKDVWTNVAVRGPFLSAGTTPFKIESSEPAMPGGNYSLFRVEVRLAPAATEQDSSYTSDIAIYGRQDAGSLSGW
jgi:predicted ribosomally synthesized peptide with SipW-like signal peptide